MAERKVYVLMWEAAGGGEIRGRMWFATSTRKAAAVRRCKELGREGVKAAAVYAVPYPGTGWDCPTIRAVYDPIFVAAARPAEVSDHV